MLAKFILLENMLKPSYDLSIRMAVEYIENNLSGPLSVEDISRKGNISKNTLYRGFKKEFGMTVSEYINSLRLNFIANMLRNSNYSISQIIFDSGFNNISWASECFKLKYGMTMREYRNSDKIN